MEAFKKRLKAIALFLTALILLQSCVVYNVKSPTTLEKASQEKIKTRITSNDGDIFKYKHIIFEEGRYYGVSKESGELVKTPLSPEEIAKVETQNKSASTIVTVLVVAVPVIAITVAMVSAMNNIGAGMTWGGI
jgi:hypothetical protein